MQALVQRNDQNLSTFPINCDILVYVYSVRRQYSHRHKTYDQYVLPSGFYGHHIHVFQDKRGDPKIPWNVEKNYLKYSYKFETLFPFKAPPFQILIHPWERKKWLGVRSGE
jgi:hypothetical protein